MVVGECDCSGQFNNVTPQSLMSDLTESVKWLAKKRRWNTQELVWSIHRYNKSIDRAGMGTSSRFTHLHHQNLENLVYFSLLTDTCTQASGQVWSRTRAIPMGGPFSAQSADLRSIWAAKKRTDLMRKIGQLSFSPRGHPLWTTPRGNTVHLAQFRDNILVGARGPSPTHEMQSVCDTLSEVWNLPVLCDCMTEEQRVCQRTCTSPSLTAMGFIHRTPRERLSSPDLCPTVGFDSQLAPEIHGNPPITTSTSPQTHFQYPGQCSSQCTALFAYMGFVFVEYHVLGTSCHTLWLFPTHSLARVALRSASHCCPHDMGRRPDTYMVRTYHL